MWRLLEAMKVRASSRLYVLRTGSSTSAGIHPGPGLWWPFWILYYIVDIVIDMIY